ncbi:MAG: hypothetical protein WCI73_17050, partial [Phycisphaerae bacterium]
MGDRFLKVKAGDDLDIPAAVYNEMLDALEWVRTQRSDQRGGSSAVELKPGQIWVRNNLSVTLGVCNVLAIGNALTTPTDSTIVRYLNNLVVDGTVPTTALADKIVIVAD